MGSFFLGVIFSRFPDIILQRLIVKKILCLFTVLLSKRKFWESTIKKTPRHTSTTIISNFEHIFRADDYSPCLSVTPLFTLVTGIFESEGGDAQTRDGPHSIPVQNPIHADVGRVQAIGLQWGLHLQNRCLWCSHSNQSVMSPFRGVWGFPRFQRNEFRSLDRN